MNAKNVEGIKVELCFGKCISLCYYFGERERGASDSKIIAR